MTEHRKHILVVEDEHHLAVGIKFNLEAEGYDVTVAQDGRVALQTVFESPGSFDLMILDVMLPGMNGYDLCERLRADGVALPILILSARTLTEDKTRGFAVGANQYLVKPFELDELIARVRNLIALGPTNPRADSAVLQENSNPEAGLREFNFADNEINFETFQVTVRNKPVKMTALQMKLLRYFVANQGRVIPRAELLENVWEMPGNMQTRAPDQFISMLRKTFELDPAKPVHFLTIRDAGYRFVASPSDENGEIHQQA